jgi:hypothetical protein
VLTSSVIVIALVKVRIIFREFMEVRSAPVLLCRLTDAWVVIMAVAMLGCYSSVYGASRSCERSV